jgi:hypothetical protein
MSDQSPSLPDLRVPAPQLEPDDAFVAQLASLAAASATAPPRSTASSWRIGLAAAAVAAVLGGGAWLSSTLTGTDAPAPPTSPATRPAVTPAPPASPNPSDRAGRTKAGQVRGTDDTDARPGGDPASSGRSGTQPSAPQSSATTGADGQTGSAPDATAPGAPDGDGPGQSGQPHGQHTPDADPPGHGSGTDHGQGTGNDEGNDERGSDGGRGTDDHDSDTDGRGAEDQPAGG